MADKEVELIPLWNLADEEAESLPLWNLTQKQQKVAWEQWPSNTRKLNYGGRGKVVTFNLVCRPETLRSKSQFITYKLFAEFTNFLASIPTLSTWQSNNLGDILFQFNKSKHAKVVQLKSIRVLEMYNRLGQQMALIPAP